MPLMPYMEALYFMVYPIIPRFIKIFFLILLYKALDYFMKQPCKYEINGLHHIKCISLLQKMNTDDTDRRIPKRKVQGL